MCAAEAAVRAASPSPRAPARGGRVAYGSIVLIGGGCYGSYYLRQLTRARDAGALMYERLVVVDRDARCRVALAAERARAGEGGAPGAGTGAGQRAAPDATPGRGGGPPQLHDRPELDVARHHFAAVRLEIAEWSEFLPRYLDAACARPEAHDADAIVPSPLMPHVLFDWLLGRARARWPERDVHAAPLEREPSIPWQRAAPDGTHYVSFAEWMCPINCVEPPLCPEIRGPRTWSMPPAVRAYADAERARGRPLAGPLLFHCEHRAFGVGMIDTAAAVAAEAALAEAALAAAGSPGPFRALVATVSHCHGALGLIQAEPAG